MTGLKKILDETKMSQFISLKKGQVLFSKDTTPEGIYIVIKGSVGFLKQSDDKASAIQCAAPGNIVGLNALIKKMKFMHTAVATEDSMICFLPEKEFMQLLNEKPDLSHQILVSLSNQLDEAENKLCEFSDTSAMSAVARCLLEMEKAAALSAEKKTLGTIKKDLAAQINSKVQTIDWLFAEFDQAGLIEIKNNRVVIKDQKGLKKISEIVTNN